MGGMGINPLAMQATQSLLSGNTDDFVKNLVATLAKAYLVSVGVPPQLADMAVESLGKSLEGDPSKNDMIDMISEEFDLAPSDAAQMVNGMDDMIKILLKGLVDQIKEDTKSESGASGRSSEGKGPQSWIMILADKLADIVDKKFDAMNVELDELTRLEGNLGKTKNWGTAKHSTAIDAEQKMPGQTQRVQAATQEFSMIMNAATNIVKTAGQAASQATTK